MLITVRVTTQAKRESVEVIDERRLAISVRESPERNEANARVIELLARHFDVAVSRVRLLRGHHKRSKVFEVRDTISR